MFLRKRGKKRKKGKMTTIKENLSDDPVSSARRNVSHLQDSSASQTEILKAQIKFNQALQEHGKLVSMEKKMVDQTINGLRHQLEQLDSD